MQGKRLLHLDRGLRVRGGRGGRHFREKPTPASFPAQDFATSQPSNAVRFQLDLTN